jgi:hypothetical protein
MPASPVQAPEFEPPKVLPFPAGTSPFRQKGNAYLGDKRYLESVVPGGYDAVIDAIPDPACRAFFRRGFKPSEWYDAYPGTQLELTAAGLRGLSFEEHRWSTGAWHARDAARGIYGTLLRFISSENIAIWAPRISSLYFEFGKTQTRVVAPSEVHVLRRGVPKELVQWVMFASAGFVQGALEAAGAHSPEIALLDIEADGREYGRDLVKVGMRLAWTE